MTCEHKRLKHGYEKTYDVQWCLNCGVITHSSDGLIGPGLHKRTDWSDWINVNLEAWSCRNEAHDGKRCSHWCGGATCPASIRSVATTTKNDPIQPAHRALLRQYESITNLESRLAAATDRITTLTEERDLAAAQSTNESWIKTVREIGHAVNCLYSTFPDANGHIVSAIQKLKADLAAAQAERDALFRSKSTLNTRVLAAEAEVQALRVAHEAALAEAVAKERDLWSSAVAKHCSMEIVQSISNELRNANENRTPT